MRNTDGDASVAPTPFVPCSSIAFRLMSFHGSLHLEQKEEEFVVYEPYCANYTNASELMLMEEQNLVVRLA
jgi:hypothetical protein